jgi:hypothetical protein
VRQLKGLCFHSILLITFWPLWLFDGTIDELKQETNKYAITNVLFHHIGNDMPKGVGQA